jgi:hypothetical protein
VRQYRFRALITLDPAGPCPGVPGPPVRQYPNRTCVLMIVAMPLHGGTGPSRCFPAKIWWHGDEPLHPGDHAMVTARVADDQAGLFLGTGQRFTLWSGGEVGHGTVYRIAFTGSGSSGPGQLAAASEGPAPRAAARPPG